MSFFFTTHWGAIYLAALALTMIPALILRKHVMLALTMVFLWLLDRIAVTFLPVPECLAFLAFAYFVVSTVVAMFHPPRSVNYLVSFFLAATALPFAFGTLGYLTWDFVGSAQELLGLFCMLTILFWPRHDGSRVPDQQSYVVPDRDGYRSAGRSVAKDQDSPDSKASH